MSAQRAVAGLPLAVMAADWLKACPVYLGVAATGNGPRDELLEIAILDCDGMPLLDTLIRPVHTIPPAALAAHGIAAEALAAAPAYRDRHERLAKLISRRLCLVYDATRVLRLIHQTALAARVYPHELRAECVMHLFEWWRGGRPPLVSAVRACGIGLPASPHRAAPIAELTRRLVHQIAEVPL